MSFERSTLPDRVPVRGPGSLLSVRGNLLTYLDGEKLWVVRSGDDPRAWSKPVDEAGNGTGGWSHGRPRLNEVLRPLERFDRTNRGFLADLGESWIQSRRSRSSGPVQGRKPRRGERKRALWECALEGDPLANGRYSRATICRTFLQQEDECSGRRAPVSDYYYLWLRRQLRSWLKLKQVSRWVAQFPPEALQYLDRHGFTERRWHVLNLWMRVPEGRDLYEDLPQLAWMMASSWNIKQNPVQKPFRSFRSLVRKKRRQILEWMDLPGGRGSIRLLRRVPVAEMRPLTVHYLARVLREERGRSALLNFEGPIDATVLCLLGKGEAVSLPLLEAMAKHERVGHPFAGQEVKELFFDSRRLLRLLDREREFHRLGQIQTGDRLREYHDDLVAEFNERGAPLGREGRSILREWSGSQPPPIRPVEGIRPLDTWEALRHEGRVMSHCVGSYASRIVRGTYYVYAVEQGGERATLGLKRNREGKWMVDQLRGRANRPVSSDLHDEVMAWFRYAPPDGRPRDQQLLFEGFEAEPGLPEGEIAF